MRWLDKQRIRFNAKVRKRVNLYEVIMEVGRCNAMHGVYLTRREARAACREGVSGAEDLYRTAMEQYPDIVQYLETPTVYAVDLVTHINAKEKRVKPRVDVFTEKRKEQPR